MIAAMTAVAAVGLDGGLVRGWGLRGIRHIVDAGFGVVGDVEEDVIG